MGKAPSFPWYPNDFDRDLGKCTPSTVGIWARCLNQMWYEKPRGKLSMPRGSFLILCRCSDQEFQQFLNENTFFSFADVTVNHESVTVINRRMFREEKEREKARIRQDRHRKSRDSNAEVTLPSSSSSSSSKHKSSQKRISDDTHKVFKHFTSKKNLIHHRRLTDKQASHVNAKLEDFTVDEICDSIDNYSRMLANPSYRMDYRWTIDQFMTRGLEKFLSENEPFRSYPRIDNLPPLEPDLPTDDTGKAMETVDGKLVSEAEWDVMYRQGLLVPVPGGWKRKEPA